MLLMSSNKISVNKLYQLTSFRQNDVIMTPSGLDIIKNYIIKNENCLYMTVSDNKIKINFFLQKSLLGT